MIDETVIRAVLESVLGNSFNGFPVGRVGDPFTTAAGAPHYRTLLVIPRPVAQVDNCLSMVNGMFSVFALVPTGLGLTAAEDMARCAKEQFYPIDQYLGQPPMVRVVGAGLVVDGFSPWQGDGPGWTAATAQVDWSVTQIG